MKWFPLLNYTHYSLCLGFSKPEELVKKCKLNGYRACGIADYKSISGAVAFYKACVANDIKPIIGCSFGNFSLFAKNKDGWNDLIELVSSLDIENNIELTKLISVCNRQNLISISKNECFSPISGKDFYEKSPLFYETYYVDKSQTDLHRILLSSGMKMSLNKIYEKITKGEQVDHQEFFEYNNYFLPDNNEVSEIILNDPDCLNKFDEIYDKCEQYDILSKPILPKFPTPNNESEEEYLKELCRVGWKNILINNGKVDTEEKKQTYLSRFLEEFEVIKNANLFGYFLIVQDIIKYVNKNGWMAGPGRGCFLPDTRVKMANGEYRPINTIKIGDKVIDAYSELQTVEDILEYDVDEEIIELEMENGKIIRCTKDHKFLTNNRGWVEAQNLTETDDIKEI